MPAAEFTAAAAVTWYAAAPNIITQIAPDLGVAEKLLTQNGVMGVMVVILLYFLRTSDKRNEEQLTENRRLMSLLVERNQATDRYLEKMISVSEQMVEAVSHLNEATRFCRQQQTEPTTTRRKG